MSDLPSEPLLWLFLVLLAALFLLSFVAPPLLAARKSYAWSHWTLACSLPGLIILAFFPYANQPDESEEVNRSRRQRGNKIGTCYQALDYWASCSSWPI